MHPLYIPFWRPDTAYDVELMVQVGCKSFFVREGNTDKMIWTVFWFQSLWLASSFPSFYTWSSSKWGSQYHCLSLRPRVIPCKWCRWRTCAIRLNHVAAQSSSSHWLVWLNIRWLLANVAKLASADFAGDEASPSSGTDGEALPVSCNSKRSCTCSRSHNIS